MANTIQSIPNPRENLRARGRKALRKTEAFRWMEEEETIVSPVKRIVKEPALVEPLARIKRTKERSLADIIQKVTEWRQLYGGVMEKNA